MIRTRRLSGVTKILPVIAHPIPVEYRPLSAGAGSFPGRPIRPRSGTRCGCPPHHAATAGWANCASTKSWSLNRPAHRDPPASSWTTPASTTLALAPSLERGWRIRRELTRGGVPCHRPKGHLAQTRNKVYAAFLYRLCETMRCRGRTGASSFRLDDGEELHRRPTCRICSCARKCCSQCTPNLPHQGAHRC
jgi:hypothetical protein